MKFTTLVMPVSSAPPEPRIDLSSCPMTIAVSDQPVMVFALFLNGHVNLLSAISPPENDILAEPLQRIQKTFMETVA